MSDTTTRNQHLTKMKIWQQNVNRSLIAQTDVLHSTNPKEYDMILLQEPYIDFLGATRATLYWMAIYPPQHCDAPKRSQSIILVNKRIATSSWTQINIPSFDITAVQLHGEQGTLEIFNIYNDCLHNDSLTSLAKHLQSIEHRAPPRTQGP